MKLKIFFQNHSKLFIFDLEFEFRDLILMEKIPHTPYLCLLLLLNFVVSVSVSVSAESIGQLQFRFRYRAETKMVVSVVHYQDCTPSKENVPANTPASATGPKPPVSGMYLSPSQIPILRLKHTRTLKKWTEHFKQSYFLKLQLGGGT